MIELQSIIEPTKNWIRKLPWTVIANGLWEVLYTQPSWEENIDVLLKNLEDFINNFDDDIDALIKMPVIHYQFESIYPFYDGNGETWRILNVLYLILAKKLDFPILFLSEYINENREEYYSVLNKATISWDYGECIIYFLKGIIDQSQKTAVKIIGIKKLMWDVRRKISQLNMDYHKITEILFSSPFLTVWDFEKNFE